MKNFAKYLFVLMGGTVILPSCNDFLDREPLDSVVPSVFFQNENDLAAYAIKHYNFTTHEGWNLGIWGNDNATDNQAATNYNNQWIPGQWRTIETNDSDPWNFTAIREANYFFEQVLPKEGQIQGENVSHYIGEMYFLRAKNYFDKVKTFGDFPIVKTTLPDEMEALVAASKREPSYKVVDYPGRSRPCHRPPERHSSERRQEPYLPVCRLPAEIARGPLRGFLAAVSQRNRYGSGRIRMAGQSRRHCRLRH